MVPFLLALVACEPLPQSEVLATLDDGQVLVGTVATDTLVLEGGLGTLHIPLEDVGEITPVEGGSLDGSRGNVTVWLRNGSELTGRWAEPELRMAVALGGRTADIDLPVSDLLRTQLMTTEHWPDEDVFRVRTVYGDDLLVDAAKTRIRVESTLGNFEVLLDECDAAAPLGDPQGDWSIRLRSGTVLRGPVDAEAISFALAMGPDRVEVPLDALVSLERQRWSAPEAPAAGPGGWFSSGGYRQEKALH